MAENISSEVGSHGFKYGVKHFKNLKSGYLTDLVSETLMLTKQQVLDLLHLGAIYVENYRQNEDLKIKEDQLFRVHTKPRRHLTDFDWKQRILFEDSDFLILNKPSGVPSHAAVDNIKDNSLYQVEQALQVKLMITHRLDTLTEGLIVYGKTKRFVNDFNKQITARLIQKKYVALIETTKSLPTKLIHYMESSPRAPKKVTEFYQENSALCELEILEQKIEQDLSWVKINLLTGRTHQIRAQVSAMNAPILGDTLYGSKKSWKENAIALRACEIEFMWNTKIQLFKLPENLI